MPTRILVAYASKHGATAEIAERIADAIRETGCDAQALPAASVDDLSAYDAVVLGSAVYGGRWQHDARAFARRHRRALEHMPVWLFSSGPFGGVEDHPTARTPHGATKLADRLHARHHVTFGGRVPSDPRNFVERAILESTNPDHRDARDWNAIEEWARWIASELAVTGSRA